MDPEWEDERDDEVAHINHAATDSGLSSQSPSSSFWHPAFHSWSATYDPQEEISKRLAPCCQNRTVGGDAIMFRYGMIDVLSSIRSNICLIETPGRSGSGIAFNLGQSNLVAIITCHHIVPSMAVAKRSKVYFRSHNLTETSKAWTINEQQFQTDYENDWAFFALKEQFAVNPLNFSTASPQLRQPIMVLQHPMGDECHFSKGTVIGTAPTALLYNATTDMDSSGGPGITEQGSVLSIHRRSREGEDENEGILVWPIVKTLQAKLLAVGNTTDSWLRSPSEFSVTDFQFKTDHKNIADLEKELLSQYEQRVYQPSMTVEFMRCFDKNFKRGGWGNEFYALAIKSRADHTVVGGMFVYKVNTTFKAVQCEPVRYKLGQRKYGLYITFMGVRPDCEGLGLMTRAFKRLLSRIKMFKCLKHAKNVQIRIGTSMLAAKEWINKNGFRLCAQRQRFGKMYFVKQL